MGLLSPTYAFHEEHEREEQDRDRDEEGTNHRFFAGAAASVTGA